MLGASATSRRPNEPPRRPMSIHGRRMPSRDEVRSLILPKNGLPNIATRAPIPATSARLFGAFWIPTSAFTFNAKVTSRGAMNTRQVLMYANVYREMNPQPTRSATSGSASAAFRYPGPSNPAAGDGCGWALGVLTPGRGTSGICAPLQILGAVRSQAADGLDGRTVVAAC